MSTPPAPTDAEDPMDALQRIYSEVMDTRCMHWHEPPTSFADDMRGALRAAGYILVRASSLRAPSAGKSEPQTPWQGEDA